VYPRVSDLQPKVFQQDGASPLHSSLLIWGPWTTLFQTAGLGSTDQSLGYRVRRISHFWVSVWSSVRNRMSMHKVFPQWWSDQGRGGGVGGWQGLSV
jgi:hypothetical protein